MIVSPSYPKIKNIFKYSEDGKYLYGKYSMPVFEYLRNNEWILEEKIDGTNTRVIFDGENIYFKGRRENSQLPAPLLNKLKEIFNESKKDTFKVLFGDESIVTLYGEGVGPKIQKRGKYYFNGEYNFVLFDVLIGNTFLSRDDVLMIAFALGISKAPVITKGTLDMAVELAKKGFKSAFGNVEAEGIVARPVIELRTNYGERIIAKIRTEDFKRI